MYPTVSVRRRLAVAVLAGLSSMLGFAVWYVINMSNKLSAALNPNLALDPGRGAFKLEFTVPSAIIPALFVMTGAALVAALVLTAIPSRMLLRLPATSIIAGPVLLWGLIAGTFATNRFYGVPSDEWLAVFTRQELAAASLVLLVPSIVAAVTIRRRAEDEPLYAGV